MVYNTDLLLAIDWLGYAIQAELKPDDVIRDFDFCVFTSEAFAENSQREAYYSFSKASNLPYPDNQGYFVTCSKRDMQPYRCDSVLAHDLDDAYHLARFDAFKHGESTARINGEYESYPYGFTEKESA